VRRDAGGGEWKISSLYPGSAAQQSGLLKAGDELLRIDKVRSEQLTEEQVYSLLAGEEGSLVQVRVKRDKKFTYDACLERRQPRGPPPPNNRCRPTQSSEAADPQEIVDRISRGIAKINAVMERPLDCERLSPEDLEEWRKKNEEKTRRQQAKAQRQWDATRRRHAEIGVLKRELKELEKLDAPFVQLVDYRNWIRRLEYQEDGIMDEDIDSIEQEAEKEELEERLHLLELTLRQLETEDMESSESDRAAIVGKLQLTQSRLEMLRGSKDRAQSDDTDTGSIGRKLTLRPAAQPRTHRAEDTKGGFPTTTSQVAGHQPAGQDPEVEGPATAQESTGHATDLLQPDPMAPLSEMLPTTKVSSAASQSATASVAAELRTKWMDKGEPREGVRLRGEEREEVAPQPCMLAQATVAYASSMI